MAEAYPIPTRINILIIVVSSFLFALLLYLGTHTQYIGLKVLLGIAFGIVMIPVYSLMHEGAHNALHPDPHWNVFLGRWLGCLFIIPFTFFRHCHLKHHKKNRTDEEMWDLYYEHQNKWLRYGNLYLMMIGFGYMAVWLSVVLYAFAPTLVNSRLLRKHTEMRGFLEGSDGGFKLRTSQAESIVVLMFQAFCLWMMHWDVQTWLIFYLLHGFVWSSQNYINHAFSPRDIINGAHNLKVPIWLKFVYLNFNLHLAHHQNPKIPWVHLPKYVKTGGGRIPFYRNYLRLWKGPRLTTESSPKMISN